MSENPAPLAEGAPPSAKPVTYSDILQRLQADVAHHQARREIADRELVNPDLAKAERESWVRWRDREDRAAEIYSTAWRALWMVHTDPGLKRHVREVAAAEVVAGDDGFDQTRYDE